MSHVAGIPTPTNANPALAALYAAQHGEQPYFEDVFPGVGANQFTGIQGALVGRGRNLPLSDRLPMLAGEPGSLGRRVGDRLVQGGLPAYLPARTLPGAILDVSPIFQAARPAVLDAALPAEASVAAARAASTLTLEEARALAPSAFQTRPEPGPVPAVETTAAGSSAAAVAGGAGGAAGVVVLVVLALVAFMFFGRRGA